MRKFYPRGTNFKRGTIDPGYYCQLMRYKKALKVSFPDLSEADLTLPALQRYDRAITPVKFRVIIQNKENILRILRGQ